MDDDPQTTTNCKGEQEEDCQDRRQFFNGLGKWSLAIIAAVSSLTGSGTRAQANREEAPKSEPEPQRPAWTVPDDSNPRVRMAGYFKKRHGDTHLKEMKHWDSAHVNTHGNSGIQ